MYICNMHVPNVSIYTIHTRTFTLSQTQTQRHRDRDTETRIIYKYIYVILLHTRAREEHVKKKWTSVHSSKPEYT